MIETVWLLAWRSLWDRPRRTAVLLAGYGIGVAVVIALLSVGDALLAQARDRDLIAGGDLVLLPEGIDPDVLKVNGAADLYFTIQQAGFLIREVLRGARFGREIAGAAPQIDTRQIYLRRDGRTFPALASGGIPSLDRDARATAGILGARDTPADVDWIAPSPGVLIDRLDRFHAPPHGTKPTWAEWDYFNFLDSHTGAYGYVTVLAGGEGRGAILARIKRPAHEVEDIVIRTEVQPGALSIDGASQRIGPARIRNENGRYHLTVDHPRLRADLWLTPVAGFYLPAGEVAGDAVISGYVVPALRGWMSGSVRTAQTGYRLAHALAYHDHNWGTWRGVSWEWGEASGDGGAMLYGGLHVAGRRSSLGGPVLFLWETRRGDGAARRGAFLGSFPIRTITYNGWHPGPLLEGRRVGIPSAVAIHADSGSDHVSVRIRITDGLASAVRPEAAASPPSGGRRPPGVAFLQLRGIAEARGTVDGRAVEFSSLAAVETFVSLTPQR